MTYKIYVNGADGPHVGTFSSNRGYFGRAKDMIDSLIEMLGLKGLEQKRPHRRRAIRRAGHKSLMVVGDNRYVVKNWSPEGALIDAMDMHASVGDRVPFTIKFRLEHGEISIEHEAEVVRTDGDRHIAMKFVPMPVQSRQLFDRVIDYQLTEQFANSQAGLHEEIYA